MKCKQELIIPFTSSTIQPEGDFTFEKSGQKVLFFKIYSYLCTALACIVHHFICSTSRTNCDLRLEQEHTIHEGCAFTSVNLSVVD